MIVDDALPWFYIRILFSLAEECNTMCENKLKEAKAACP